MAQQRGAVAAPLDSLLKQILDRVRLRFLQSLAYDSFYFGDDLLDVQAGGIDVNRVRRGHQWRRSTRGVTSIALLQITNQLCRQLRVVRVGLGDAALRSNSLVGVEEDFYIGIGKDHGANVPALHDDSTFDSQLTLQVNHHLSH